MNVLMISPYFAPCTMVGALRMTSLAKYLVAQGTDVTVIKLSESSYDTGGLATGERVPGVVYEEFSADMEDWQKVTFALGESVDTLCKKNHYDCCIATFGPFATIPGVISMVKTHGIPLVADYRDLWVFHPMPLKTVKDRLVYGYVFLRYYHLEKQLMKHCAKFVSVTPRSVERMVHFYPVLRDKSHCIYNGYTDVLKDKCARMPSKTFQIYFLGKLSYYSLEGTRSFFRAVHTLIQKGYPIRIVHIGKKEQVVDKIIQELGFPSEVFTAEGLHPYEEAMQMAQSANMFMAINRDPDGLETKVFDYIYLNKPIVAYGPADSEFGEMIARGENSYMCHSETDIERAIETIILEKQETFTQNMDFWKSLSREAQNSRYLQLLQSLKK